MRKQVISTGPSRAVGLALSTLAASYVEEEKKKQKKRKRASLTGLGADPLDEGGFCPGFPLPEKLEHGENRLAREEEISRSENPFRSALTESSNLPVNVADDVLTDPAKSLDDEWSIPSDTVVALRMMCAQFPKIDQTSIPPFVLRTQLYSSVSDRTSVDRDLEGLRQQQVLRVFKLSTGQDDFAIMFVEDYVEQIAAVKKRMSAKRLLEEVAVFDWFTSHVLSKFTGVSIKHSELVLVLAVAGRVKETHVSLLIHAGLLVRQLVDENSYWFGIPNVGYVLRSISQGRKELLSFLGKRRYKEILQGVLDKRKLRSSQFDMRFHIRDLLGTGQLFSVHTPVGPLLRLSRH